jgi:hypothetical protein
MSEIKSAVILEAVFREAQWWLDEEPNLALANKRVEKAYDAWQEALRAESHAEPTDKTDLPSYLRQEDIVKYGMCKVCGGPKYTNYEGLCSVCWVVKSGLKGSL